MRKKTLGKVADRAKLRLSLRGVVYRMNSKEGGKAVITSVKSGRTYRYPLSKVCWDFKQG